MMTFHPFAGDPARRAGVLAGLPPLAGEGPMRALAGGPDDPARACAASNFPFTLLTLGEALAAALPKHQVAAFTLRFVAAPALERDLADVAEDFINEAVSLALATHRAGRIAKALHLPPHADALAVRNRARSLAFDHGRAEMACLIATLANLEPDPSAAANALSRRLLDMLSADYSSHKP